MRLEKSKNSDYWINKISKNKERDKAVNQELLLKGWTVIRFWGKDIKRNVVECVHVVEETIFELKIENGKDDF